MRLLVLAAASLLGLAGCGNQVAATQELTPSPRGARPVPTASQPHAPAAPVAEVGGTVRFQDGATAGTITLKRTKRIPGAQAGRPYARPTHGSFLVAHVKMTVTRGSALVGALAFRAQTPDGRTYPASPGVVAEPINAHGLPVPAGESAHGDVAFDVPEGPVLILYAPSGTALASFTVVAATGSAPREG